MDFEKKILVVDDFETMRRIVKTILKKLGYLNISEAFDGQDALQKIKSDKYDLVLSDCNMPNMDGLELLKLLKGDNETKKIPFIVMTTSEQEKKMVEMAMAGMDDYIVKPFTPQSLKDKLENFLK